MTNPHEDRARRTKAWKLAQVARQALGDVSIEQLRAATADQRHRFAVLADVPDPSETTWAAVVALIERDPT